MIKKLYLSIFFLFGLLLSGAVSNAESFANDYKNPNANLGEIETVWIQPIQINPELKLDNFDQLRIESIIGKELKNFPFPYHWQGENEKPGSDLSNIAILKIDLHQFNHYFYESEGGYIYSRNSPTFHTGFGFGFGNHFRHSRRRSSGFGIGVSISPGSGGQYVSSETYNHTEVELRFTLESPNGEITYWIYNEENITDPTRKALSPDDNLKKIVKNGFKNLQKQLKEDKKILEKQKKENKND